jgi:hypothetical protein
VLRQNVIVVSTWQKKLLTSWQLGSKERNMKGKSPNIPFKGTLPVTYLTPTRSCLLEIHHLPIACRLVNKPLTHRPLKDTSKSQQDYVSPSSSCLIVLCPLGGSTEDAKRGWGPWSKFPWCILSAVPNPAAGYSLLQLPIAM